ncbi:hypothetical protein TRFO_14181 [Tritrichomonas foetus]|uniref:Protein kinase domain-containing protein n=1 Tax=Tritrichomonas foetus TaxID=1144522 RepID=A0A1J4KVM7_9EUKA|nr:hypothetical protein TRFO_14181 [Tritrichomonas foetus]|eukprot:OHT15283.1 hypothetical protein TRFO_14181 [Tritrichomonas foetus]
MISANRAAIQEKYDLLQELPCGFLGPSVVVKNKETQEIKVCKICHKRFIGLPEKIDSFRDRLKTLQDISDDLPFIIPYTDVIENEDDFFVFREYIQLDTITDFLNDNVNQEIEIPNSSIQPIANSNGVTNSPISNSISNGVSFTHNFVSSMGRNRIPSTFSSSLPSKAAYFNINCNSESNREIYKKVESMETPRKIKILWRSIIEYFVQLHQRGIFPSAIKPSNIFINPLNLNVYLCDLYELSTDISWALQTPDPMQLAFLAPEYFDVTCPPSNYSDVWSLGVILTYMLTNDLPWSTKNVCAMIKNITSYDPNQVCALDTNSHDNNQNPNGSLSGRPVVKSSSFEFGNELLSKIMSIVLVKDVTKRPSITSLKNIDLLSPKGRARTLMPTKMSHHTRPKSVKIFTDSQKTHLSNSKPIVRLVKPDFQINGPMLMRPTLPLEKLGSKRLSSGSISTSTYVVRYRFMRPESDNIPE